ncbi:hypothetical protein MMC29_002224 [Sticta canariensis]|nr:hypothetical protein [Sticta canariensis]
MLRLAPTQVTLGSRDVTWHTERHKSRGGEDQHARGAKVTGSPIRDPQESVEQPNSIVPHSFPHLPGNEPVTTDDSDTTLISGQPVPRGSRVSWDQVPADSEASTGIQVQSVERRARIIEMSCDSQEMIHSSMGSIDEDLSDSTGANHELFGMICPQNPSMETDLIPQLQSRFSSESDISFGEEEDDKDELLVSNTPSGELRQFVLPIRSSSISSNRGRFLGPTSQQDRSIYSHQLSGHTDLLGYSDSVPAHDDHQKRRLSTTSVGSNYTATRSIAQTPRIETGPISDGTSSPDNPRSSQLPLPRPVDNLRRRSNSGLPRSSLCISQVPASSSPEKRPRPPANSSDENSNHETIAEPSGLLTESPRRRKKYKARNDGYIFDEAALDSAQVYGIDGLSIADPLQSSLPTSSLSSRSGSFSDHPQNLPFGSSPASNRRNTSPHSFPSLSSPFNTLSSPALPPHPFSATPRTISPLSPSSPSASNRTVPNFSPSPTHRRMAVYNDNLPASTQPQTPARLPLNGLPAMSLQHPFGIGIGVAQTAPAGIGRRQRDSVRPTTPTRRGMGVEDQENLGVEVESRRRRVRESASREWEWEWEWDGDEENDEEREGGFI